MLKKTRLVLLWGVFACSSSKLVVHFFTAWGLFGGHCWYFRKIQGAFTSSDWVLHHLRAKNWLAVTFFILICIAEKFQSCVGIVGCAVNTIMPTASKELWDVPTTLSYINTIMPTKCWTPILQNHSSSDKLQYLQTSCTIRMENNWRNDSIWITSYGL